MAGKTPTRFNHLHSDPISFSGTSAKSLAQSQFAAAASAGYQPQAHSQLTATAAAPAEHLFKGGATSATPVAAQTSTVQNPSKSTPTATTATKPSTPAPATDVVLRAPPAQPIDLNSFNGFRFTALDQFLVETPKMYDHISGTYLWEMCEADEARCIKFIRDDCPTKRVFVITSGGQGKSLIPLIHDLPQVYAIYIHCSNMDYHREWSGKFSKVRVLCNDEKYLFPQLAVDVAQANLEWGDALVKQGKKESAKKKFTKALENLTLYTNKEHDPALEKEVQKKLQECE